MFVPAWLVIGGAAALAAGPAMSSPGAEACLACHADPSVAPDPRLEGLGASAHRKVACAGCHEKAGEVPHPSGARDAACGRCHAKASSELRASPHGAALLAGAGGLAEACAACHGTGHRVPAVRGPGSPVARRRQPETCGNCHAAGGTLPRAVEMRRPVESFQETIHGEALLGGARAAAACSDCHGAHDIRPSGDPRSRVAGPNIAATCGRCHAGESAQFSASVHGAAAARGVRAAPTCTDCHGEHSIRPPRESGGPLAPGRRAGACEDCHRSARLATRFGLPKDRVRTFESSFHGLAGRGGDVKAADCASCHGWHDVLPSSDPRSRVHPSRLSETCGRCHPGAGKRWAAAGMRVHETLARGGAGSLPARLVSAFYAVVIPLTALFMLAHNGLDLARKARSPHRRRHREREVPLSVNERWQHGANACAFLLLAYSGFALQYPEAWWARPFASLGGEAARRDAHRAAAALFLATGAAHLAYLATRRGRRRLEAFLPAWRDLRDAARLTAYNAGWSAARPGLPQFSYIEKFEYWALVWGSIVMTATGGALLFHNAALAWLPLWTVEVARIAHYLEAVLACLAILLWHGYWVILDPEVYPMDWAWLFGTSRLPGAPRHAAGAGNGEGGDGRNGT